MQNQIESIMKTIVKSVLMFTLALLFTGCVMSGSGNVAQSNKKPMPYKPEELAIVKVEKITVINGVTNSVVETTTKTGLAATVEDRHDGWKTARVVGTAQAKPQSSGTGFFGWLLGPPVYSYGYSGGGSYGGGGFNPNGGFRENLGYNPPMGGPLR